MRVDVDGTQSYSSYYIVHAYVRQRLIEHLDFYFSSFSAKKVSQFVKARKKSSSRKKNHQVNFVKMNLLFILARKLVDLLPLRLASSAQASRFLPYIWSICSKLLLVCDLPLNRQVFANKQMCPMQTEKKKKEEKVKIRDKCALK